MPIDRVAPTRLVASPSSLSHGEEAKWKKKEKKIPSTPPPPFSTYEDYEERESRESPPPLVSRRASVTLCLHWYHDDTTEVGGGLLL